MGHMAEKIASALLRLFFISPFVGSTAGEGAAEAMRRTRTSALQGAAAVLWKNVPFRWLVFQNRGKYAIIKFIIPGTAAPPRWGRVLYNLPEVFLWNWNGWAKAAH